jgi:pyridoxamine 5'-phosphate oxidase-like protein
MARMSELEKNTSWDSLDGFSVDKEEMLDFIDAAHTCVFIRNRRDGHPVGFVVGHHVMDGEIYVMTNTFRSTYRALLRDTRCSAVFDNHMIGTITVIGQAELVDDQTLIERYYDEMSVRNEMVVQGDISAEEFKRMAYTPNRRAVRVVPEKFISLDLRKLPKE